MREILFRAFIKDKAKIYTVKKIDFDYSTVWFEEENKPTDTMRMFDQIELMQFTGLTDKNGTKIFEGDIVAYNTLYIDGKEHQEIGYFECDEKYVNFKIHGTQMTPFNCEVIGNIHDNKELLGEQQ